MNEMKYTNKQLRTKYGELNLWYACTKEKQRFNELSKNAKCFIEDPEDYENDPNSICYWCKLTDKECEEYNHLKNFISIEY